MPKRSKMRNGPRMSERTRRGWRRTSFISLPTKAPALVRRLRSVVTRFSFSCDFGVAVHQLDEDLVECRFVLGDVADGGIIGLHGLGKLGNSAARIIHMDAHFVARAWSHFSHEREFGEVVDDCGV